MRDQLYRPFGGLRLALALLVLISHSNQFLPDPVRHLALGNVGVFTFFVVSGFVIAEALDVFYRGRAGAFLVNRCLKIYPAYWAALLVAAFVIWLSGRHLGWLAAGINLSLLGAYLPGAAGALWISITWAVLVEFQFYLVAAAVTLIRRIAAPALVLALAGYLFVWATGSYHRFFGALQFAPFFVAGVSAYLVIVRKHRGALPLLLSATLLSGHAYWRYNAGPATWDGATTVLFFLAFAALLALACWRPPLAMKGTDRTLGDLSYPLYLVHMPMIGAASYLGLQSTGAFAFVLITALMLAGIIHLTVERPMMAWRNHFRRVAL